MESDQLTAAIDALERIRKTLLTIEILTRRDCTPGRMEEIERRDSLSGWDSRILRMANEVDIDVMRIADRANCEIDEKIEAWQQFGNIHEQGAAKE